MVCNWHEIRAEITAYMTDEDVIDLICTAIESGIGYWACLDNTGELFVDAPEEEPVSETVAKILLKGGGVTILDDEDRSRSWTLTLDKLLKGVEMFIKNEQNGSMYVEEGRIGIECIDAIGADSIIQYALFGEQVYA